MFIMIDFTKKYQDTIRIKIDPICFNFCSYESIDVTVHEKYLQEVLTFLIQVIWSKTEK